MNKIDMSKAHLDLVVTEKCDIQVLTNEVERVKYDLMDRNQELTDMLNRSFRTMERSLGIIERLLASSIIQPNA